MKKPLFIKLSFLVATTFLLSGCLKEEFDPLSWAIDPELVIAEESLVFGPFSEKKTMKIQCNYNEFQVSSDADWCHIETNCDSLLIHVQVDDNTTQGYRTSMVRILLHKANKSLEKSFQVIQNGGSLDVIGDWNVFWHQDITPYQKETLSAMLLNLVRIDHGTFLMGGQGIDSLANNYFPYLFDSTQVHRVTITKDYYIGRYEVSQKEWNAVMDNNPSRFVGDELPIENITWQEATEFLDRLSHLTLLNFRLPTEAEWEYAARGGQYSQHYLYAGSNNYNDVAKYVNNETNTNYTTDAVGSYLPNELGLYNMSGNVGELCSDWYGDYVLESATDPTGPSTGLIHLTRSGSFADAPSIRCTVYSRFILSSSQIASKQSYVGLRICINP